MPYIRVGQENSGNINLYYEDHGTGEPIVLVHGWPLSGASWEKQVPALLDAGYRVITYDRRGFGKSSRPVSGFEYNTLAADLEKLLTKLDLHDATLVGFSMGGGEVARYLGAYPSKRVKKAVFIASITPFLLKTDENPEGTAGAVFDGIEKAITADRLAFLSSFLADFYNFDVLGGHRVSSQVVQSNWNVAADASPTGTFDCVSAWLTDFRKDLAGIEIPTLVIHGDADRILPFAATGKRTHALLKESQLLVVKGGPHGITWTHADIVNQGLLTFLGAEKDALKEQGKVA